MVPGKTDPMEEAVSPLRSVSPLPLMQEYRELDESDVYSQAVFNRTAEEVTKFETEKNRPAFTPSWILKITWDHVLPVFFHQINSSQVKTIDCL